MIHFTNNQQQEHPTHRDDHNPINHQLGMTLINNLLNLSSSIVAKIEDIVTAMPTIVKHNLYFHDLMVCSFLLSLFAHT